jgi:serine/threonine protein kinase
MDYIHSFGIIHGDLKLGNVLLKTHRVDRRGYVAKVSDFGMCKSLCIACCAGQCSMCKRLVAQGM